MGLYLVHPETADFTSPCKELLHSFQRKRPQEILNFERSSGCFWRLWYWNINRTLEVIIVVLLLLHLKLMHYQENKDSPKRSLGESPPTVELVLPRMGLIGVGWTTFFVKAILEFWGSAVFSVFHLRCLFAGSLLPPPASSTKNPKEVKNLKKPNYRIRKE